MRCSWLVSAAAILMLPALAARAEEPVPLKVLYAGNVGSDRAKDFTSFLEKHFAEVNSVELPKFRESDAKDYDVVIFDWTSIYPRDESGKVDYGAGSIHMPPFPHVSRRFDRPTILIGAAGGRSPGSKIDWL